MKNSLVIAVVIGVCISIVSAAPIDDSETTILRLDSDVHPEGYKFALVYKKNYNILIQFIFCWIAHSYETSDGVTREEEAELKNVGAENESIAVRGSVSWVAPDGQTYTLNYIADENGFQPEGDHLPKA